MKKGSLLLILISLIFIIQNTQEVNSLVCGNGLSPTSTTWPSANLQCGPSSQTEACIDPDTDSNACSTYVCKGTDYFCNPGSQNCNYINDCTIGNFGFGVNCDETRGVDQGFSFGWAPAGETDQGSQGGYSNVDIITQNYECCGDDSTASSPAENLFNKAPLGDQIPAPSSVCCQTSQGDSPEIVHRGICCDLGPTSAANIFTGNVLDPSKIPQPDENENACRGIPNTAQGLYQCAGGDLIVNLIDSSSTYGFPGDVCGDGSESCWLNPSLFGPGTQGNCCGDDSNEVNVGCQLAPDLNDGSTCPVDDYSCSVGGFNGPCIYNGEEYLRYQAGICTGSPGGTCKNLNDASNDYEMCYGDIGNGFKWADQDQDSSICSSQGNVWIANSLYCEHDELGRWGDPQDRDCDDANGVDLNFGTGFCCGDDQEEFVNVDGGPARCCNSASSNYNDCIAPQGDGTLLLTITSPNEGEITNTDVQVQAEYEFYTSVEIQMHCAITTDLPYSSYGGTDQNGWQQSTPTITDSFGTLNFNLNGLQNFQTYDITVGCYEGWSWEVDAYDTVQVNVNANCNGLALDPGEECDGANFPSGTNLCSDHDSMYSSGVLSCNNDCTLNVSQCVTTSGSICGNDIREDPEDCDGDLLNGYTCATDSIGDGSGLPLSRCGAPGETIGNTDISCQCIYESPFSGDQTIRYSGSCENVDKNGIGTVVDQIITYFESGENSTTTQTRACVGTQVNEPAIGTIGIILTLLILAGFYYFKRKNNKN